MLNDLNLEYQYESDEEDLLNDFYIPALANSVKYYRMAGYFNSSSLSISARGIAPFILNNGKMKLLCGAQLPYDDVEVMKKVQENPMEYIENSFLNDLKNLDDNIVKDHLEALGWMLANHFLEIKIVLTDTGIFHQKRGIMIDSDNNKISFSGSGNETAGGWLNNDEEFKVFKYWVNGHKEFFEKDCKTFKKYWINNANKSKVIDMPEAIKKEFYSLAPTNKEELTLIKKYKNQKKKNEKDTINLRYYQKNAIKYWFNNNCIGIYEMATGTGKTITAIESLKCLSKDKDKFITVIACPQLYLVSQWEKEVKQNYDCITINASSSNGNWKTKMDGLLKNFILDFDTKIVIITTHDTFSSNDFMEKVKHFKSEKLVIVDEVHSIGSNTHRLGLKEDLYHYRLGLSATPERWCDEEGTQIIKDFFGEESFKYTIEEGLKDSYLCPYEYVPIIIDLTESESEKFKKYSSIIASEYGEKNPNQEKIDKYSRMRQKIINQAEGKFNALDEILKTKNMDKIIIFAPKTKVKDVQKICNSRRVKQHKFTYNESATKKKNEMLSKREEIIENFENGKLNAIVAIKCLDEGVDIPSAENAIIMSSTSNPREHIQRRGRMLRKYEGKEKATIYDMLVFPKEENDSFEKLRKKEIERYMGFAKNSLHRFEKLKILNDLILGE